MLGRITYTKCIVNKYYDFNRYNWPKQGINYEAHNVFIFFYKV